MEITEVLDLLNGRKKANKRLQEKLKTWCDVYYAMSLHTTGTCPYWMNDKGARVTPPEYIHEQYQWLFDNRLMNRHPNESEESRRYRYSIYRPLTKEPLLRAIGVVSGAIFQDSNYSIDLKDKEDKEFIEGNNFSGYDLIGYFNNIGIHNIIEDPNGYFLRLPAKPNYEQKGQRLEVDIKFINCKDIVYISDEELVFKECDTDYAYYVNTEAIWRFTLDDKGKKYEISAEDAEGYYAHMLGYLPISKAGGEWNSHGYFDSYFDSARALCDEFISTFSAAQVVDKEASHPFIVAVREDCPSCQGTGQISTCNTCHLDRDSCRCVDMDYNDFGLSPCRKCGGSGGVSKNPMQWIRVDKADLRDKIDHIRYVNPDISINKHHREVIAVLKEDILKSLHMYRTDKAESGEAKAIDQEGLYQFLTRMSNHLFDKVIFDTINDIIAYRNVTVQKGVIKPAVYNFQLIKPTQFRIKSEGDLLAEFKEGMDANLPVTLRQNQAVEYADKAFSGDEVQKKKIRVTNSIDALALLKVDEKLSLVVAGGATQDELVFSTQLPKYLNELIEEKGENWFLAASMEDLKKLLEAKKPKINPIVQNPGAPVINGSQQDQGAAN